MSPSQRPLPALRVEAGNAGACVRPVGDWTLASLTADLQQIRAELDEVTEEAVWDLSAVSRLDSYGALVLWHAWGRQRPLHLVIPPLLEPVFARVEALPGRDTAVEPPYRFLDGTAQLGRIVMATAHHVIGFVALVGQILIDLWGLVGDHKRWPVLEISANFYKVGVRAMPVTALVGFLIGVVMSYLSALQLKAFGADAFIVNILGLGIIRELGPVLVSVLVAGRSGSAMTAQLGVMRVTEEIDALTVMGISRYVRLVLPKVVALTFAMPLLTLWGSAVAIFGGMVSAYLQLDLSFDYFLNALPRAVPVANLIIGVGKGAVFGLLIALVACYFGLRVRPNTESLSANTTASVVASITVVILVDAVFAVATRSIGLPFK